MMTLGGFRHTNPSASFEGREIRVGTLVKHIGPIDHSTFDPASSEVDCARTLGKLAPPKIEQCTRFRRHLRPTQNI